MKKMILVLVIATAVIGIGCGESPETPRSRAADMPSPQPTKSPALSDAEKDRFTSIADELRRLDPFIPSKQEIDTRGIVTVACNLEAAYIRARDLESALSGPKGAELNKSGITDNATMQARMKALIESWGKTAVAAAKAGKINCRSALNQERSYLFSDSASVMLYRVMTEANGRNIQVQTFGISPAELRALALTKVKEEMVSSGLKKELALPEDQQSADMLGSFSNDWGFTAKELGLTAQEAEALRIE